MTQVVFHLLPTTAPKARLRYLIHLLDQTLWGHSIDLRLPDEQAAAKLDQQLWAWPSHGFLPHALGAARTDAPIRLWGAKPPEIGEILINLHPEWFPHFSGYNQVIELLDQSDALLARGRARYRTYRRLGITPQLIRPEELP